MIRTNILLEFNTMVLILIYKPQMLNILGETPQENIHGNQQSTNR